MQEFYTHSLNGHQLFQTPNLWNTYQNYNYILSQENQAWIFDPGDYEPIMNTIEKNNLSPKVIFLTHHHQDHIGAAIQLKEKFNCTMYGFEKDQHRLPPLDKIYKDEDEVELLGTTGKVLHLPGHTTGLCALYIEELKLAFSNDLIFSLGCGRVFEGSYKEMYGSLKKLSSLPDDTLLACSHEYTLNNLEFGLSVFPDDQKLLSLEAEIKNKLKNQIPTVPMTLGFEKENNPFLRQNDPTIREVLDLKEAEDWQVFAKLREMKDHS